MKRILPFFLLLFVCATAFAQTGGYNIKFQIKGLRDSAAYIGHYYGNGQYISKDTAIADSKGNLVFTGKNRFRAVFTCLLCPSAT